MLSEQQVQEKLENFLKARRKQYVAITIVSRDVIIVAFKNKYAAEGAVKAVLRERDPIFNADNCCATQIGNFNPKTREETPAKEIFAELLKKTAEVKLNKFECWKSISEQLSGQSNQTKDSK